MLKNPYLAKQAWIGRGRFWEGYMHKAVAVLGLQHLCARWRAISSHINIAHTQVFSQARQCWGSDLGMLSSVDQRQHLYKLNTSILDSACCLPEQTGHVPTT